MIKPIHLYYGSIFVGDYFIFTIPFIDLVQIQVLGESLGCSGISAGRESENLDVNSAFLFTSFVTQRNLLPFYGLFICLLLIGDNDSYLKG